MSQHQSATKDLQAMLNAVLDSIEVEQLAVVKRSEMFLHDVEQLTKVRNSAESLQGDLGYFRGSDNPVFAKLIRRELDVVNGLVDRLAVLTVIVRAD